MRKLGVSRRELFLKKIERAALNPLPAADWEFAEWKRARVDLRLSHRGSRLFSTGSARADPRRGRCARHRPHRSEIFHRGQRVGVQVGARYLDHGRGNGSRPYAEFTSALRRGWTPDSVPPLWAGEIGPSAEGLITAVLASRPHPEQGFRTCLGILKLYRGVLSGQAVWGRAVEIGGLSRLAPVEWASSSCRERRLSSPNTSKSAAKDSGAGDAVRSLAVCAAPAVTVERKSHARSPDTRTIARARPAWLGEGVQGTRTKIRGASLQQRGSGSSLLLEYETTLRRREKGCETRTRVARLRHSGQRRGCRLPQPTRARRVRVRLAACEWIDERRNLLITGASGLGKELGSPAHSVQKACGRIYPSLITGGSPSLASS